MAEPEFDRFAAEYYQQHATSIRLSGEAPEYFHRYKVADVASELMAPPCHILDFGGGIGNSIGPMREFFPTSDIVLLDPSAKSLEIAQMRHCGEAQFEKFDGKEIPFPNAAFDLAFVACVFHHIPERLHVSILEEIARVLKPGGSLFLFEHNPLNPLTRKAVADCLFDENAVLISASEMGSRVTSAGFVDPQINYRIFFPHFLRRLRFLEPQLKKVPLGAQYFIHARAPT